MKELAFRALSGSGRVRLLPAALASFYVWSVTVLPFAWGGGGNELAQAGAGVALLALLLALVLAPRPASLVAGIDVFLCACVFTWWAGRQLELRTELAVFGVGGWFAYTLAWGSLSTPSTREKQGDPGPALSPRVRPSRRAFVLLSFAALGVPVLLVLPSPLERPELFILVEATALCVGLLVIRATAQLASYFQSPQTLEYAAGRGALPAFVVVLLFLAGGLLWRLLEGG